jgi:hypothetical protein
MLRAGALEILHQETIYAYMKFPFQCVLARKSAGKSAAAGPDQGWFIDQAIDRFLKNLVIQDQCYRRGLAAVPRRGRTAVWGCGSIGTQFAVDAAWSQAEVFYVDINSANHGYVLSVSGHTIHPPQSIKDRKAELLLIASGWEEDALKQAQPYLGAGTKVCTYGDLLSLGKQ